MNVKVEINIFNSMFNVNPNTTRVIAKYNDNNNVK